MNSTVRAVLLALALALMLLIPAQAVAAPPAVIDTIRLPGTQPTALGVYSGGNRVFVVDDNSGNLLTIDPSSGQVVGTALVGSSAFDMAVNEVHGKVYVGSNWGCCVSTTNPGTGLISVVDGSTGQLIRQIDTGFGPRVQYRELVSDEAHDRVYVATTSGIGVIDAATDTITQIVPPPPYPSSTADGMALDEAANQAVFFDHVSNTVAFYDASTGSTQSLSLDQTGGVGPLDVALNHAESKVYLTMLLPPNQGEIAILILDRDTGEHKFVGKDDLEPLAFNPSTNTLFSGVQVGSRGAVVDGATDKLTPIVLHPDPNIGSGIAAIGIRQATDNAYMANSDVTFAVNGARKCAQQLKTSDSLMGENPYATGIAIDDRRELIYVSNDDDDPQIAVIRDGTVKCRPGDEGANRVFRLRAPSPQRNALRRGAVRVFVRCRQPDCTATASGVIAVPGPFDLKGASRRIRRQETAALSLRMGRAARTAIARALRQGKRVRARVVVTVRDSDDQTASRTVTVRLTG
jgi:DNA-binding beta-propeller fold protein YncE